MQRLSRSRALHPWLLTGLSGFELPAFLTVGCGARGNPAPLGGFGHDSKFARAASAGFFARGGFAFRGAKWRWGWVAVSPVSLFPALTWHSRGTGR